MAAVLLKKYVSALIAPITIAFSNTQTLVQSQISNLTTSINDAITAANAASAAAAAVQTEADSNKIIANDALTIANNAVPVNVNSNNQQVFVGGIEIVNGSTTIGTNPNITSGTGAPASIQPKGSYYLRLDGAPGTFVYVSEGGGTWSVVLDLAGLIALPSTDPRVFGTLFWNGIFLCKSAGP